MAQTTSGLGTKLSYYNGSAYVPIANRVTIDGPNITVGNVSTMGLDDTCAQSRPTYTDYGDLNLTTFFNPGETTQTYVYGLIGANASSWQLSFTPLGSNHSWTFNAFVTGFNLTGMDADGNLQYALSLKINGPITVA